MPVCDFCGRAVRCQQMRDRLGLWWWCGRCPRDDAPPTTYELSMHPDPDEIRKLDALGGGDPT